MTAPLTSSPRTASPSSTKPSNGWSTLDDLVTAILAHRAVLRGVGPSHASALDRLASDLSRVQSSLRIVASRCAADDDGPPTAAIAAAYRWALEVSTLLADLEAASLDRALAPRELEHGARRSSVAYLALVERTFDALPEGTTADDRALHWDLRTVRSAIECALLAVSELA